MSYAEGDSEAIHRIEPKEWMEKLYRVIGIRSVGKAEYSQCYVTIESW